MSRKSECHHVRELIGPYADNELDQAGRSRVEEHLKVCADCQKELRAIQALHSLVREHGTQRPDEGWLEEHRFRVLHRLRMEERLEKEVRGPVPISWLRLATVAGGLMMVLIVVIAGWRIMTAGKVQRPVSLAGIESTGQALAERVEPVRPEAVAKGTKEREEVAITRPEARRKMEQEFAASDGRSGEAEVAEAASPMKETAKALLAARPEVTEIRPVILHLPRPEGLVVADSGLVVLRLLVEPDSSVSQVVIERSSGSSLLDSITVEMAKGARFQPALREGRPVPAWVDIPIRFPEKSSIR